MRNLLAVLASGLLALPALAAGGTLTVDDRAKAFTPEGVAKAKGLQVFEDTIRGRVDPALLEATAGNQYLQLSSELLSPVGDVHIAAKEVAIQTSNNTLSVLNSFRQTQTGVTLSASHPLVQAGQTINDMKSARERTANPRMRALALMTSGLTLYSAYDALGGTKGNVLDAARNGWSIQASLGYSANSFESIFNSSLPQESVITAGGDISISATGNAAAGLRAGSARDAEPDRLRGSPRHRRPAGGGDAGCLRGHGGGRVGGGAGGEAEGLPRGGGRRG